MDIRYIDSTDDRRLISRVYENSWKEAYKGIIPADYLNSIPKGQWAPKLDQAKWHTMICIENGCIIGTSSFCKSRFIEYADAGEIISIYFLPEYWGKGYGRKLMGVVISELKEQGFSEVFLWVLEENTRARRFYEMFGFTCTDDYREDIIGGKQLREVRYVYKY